MRAARIVLARLATAALLVFVLAGADGPGVTRDTVALTPAQTVRGWGMSLAWEANVVFGSPLRPAQIPDPAERSRYMDLLFGDPAHGTGLGLNVVRYNIGGGENPDRNHCVRSPSEAMKPEARMEGFLTGPGGAYDWSRDAGQRRMLHEAQARGATVFEAFSNSAPWWMTVSGCVSGAAKRGENNLRADAVPAFTAYLARVVEHFRSQEGIAFASVSPVNEPDGTWWVLGNRQEGSFADLPMQEAIVTALARKLAGTGVIVSGTEANNLDHMTSYLARMNPAALAALGRVNVHQYNGHDPAALHHMAAALGKPLWASEVGCCFSSDKTKMAGALSMAAAIQSALNQLRAEVWCFWQTDWGVIDVDSGRPRPLKQFYAIAQYTRFIRPGFVVLSGGADNWVAAMSPDRRRLVLVAINRDEAERATDFDLGAAGRPGAAVAVYRTTADASTNLAHETARIDAKGHLIDRQPPSSVTTYVIDGSPLRRQAP